MASMPTTLGDGRWRGLALLVLNGFAQAAAAIVAALTVERAFRQLEALRPPPGREVAGIAAVLVLVAVATAALRGRERVDAERFGQSYTHDLRLHLFEHLTEMSPRTVNERTQGGTVLRFVGDLNALRRWISRGLARLVVAATMATGAIVALAFVSFVVAVSVAVTLAVGAAVIMVQGASLRSAERQARSRRARLAGKVTERVASIGVVQVHGAVERERKRVARQSDRLRNAMLHRASRLGRVDATIEATASVAVGAVLITGVTARVPPPTVAASMAVVGLLVSQVRGLGRTQEYWQGARVAREAIARFLARPTLHRDDDPTPLGDGPGGLQLDGLSLDGAVDDVTAAVEAGSSVALVGPNGAGKSSLLLLLARLVDPDRGSVLLDGQDVAAAPVEEVRASIGFVAADLPLLRGSLRQNLTYRHRQASDDDVADVIARCDVQPLIDRLDGGLEGRIAEGGRDLSAGERQRVLLARALLGAPRLLLLDEADANLDATTTRVVDRVLREHEGTTLIVTHRRERLAAVDVVWHLRDGRLVEHGPPDRLLAADGPTARLFERSHGADTVAGHAGAAPGR